MKKSKKILITLIIIVILSIIGIQMIIETFKEERSISILKFSEILLFGFAVSLDSFSVGIGLNTIYKNPFIAALIFSIPSLIFTYLGLYLGKKINELIGKISTLLGGIGLIIICFIYLIYYLPNVDFLFICLFKKKII